MVKSINWLERKYPVDMAAVAFHSSILDEIRGELFSYTERGGETEFLESFVQSTEEFELLCDDCSQCYVWHNVPLGEHPALTVLKYRTKRKLLAFRND